MVEIEVDNKVCKENFDLFEFFICCVIVYNFKGKELSWLFILFVDVKVFLKKELVVLYYECWEYELVYDEIKIDMLM